MLVPARPVTGATPVSINATSTPSPVYPARHQAVAPEYFVVEAMEFVSVPGSYDDACGASATSGEIETTDGSAPMASATRWDKVAENPSMMGSSAVIEPPSDVTKPSIRACAPERVRTMTDTSGAPADVRVPAGVRTNAATKIVRITPASERSWVRGAAATAVERSIRAFRVVLLSCCPSRAPRRLFEPAAGRLVDRPNMTRDSRQRTGRMSVIQVVRG